MHKNKKSAPTTLDCRNVRGAVEPYALTPQEECWWELPQFPMPEPRSGRILWMRDAAQFPVARSKMTKTVMRADCRIAGETGPWRVIAFEKQVPIGPVSCLEISSSSKVILFYRTLSLTAIGTATETLEERINHSQEV